MDILHLTTNPELSISVIVPAYNCGEFLHNCVLSILTSIDQNSEVLIINDGSTDNTLDVAHNMSIRDSRVRIISQANQGVSAARNTGIEHARGKYIAFVDSDDWIDAPFTIYKSMLDALTINNAEIVIAGYTTSKTECNLKLDNQVYRRGVNHDFENLILLKSIGKPYGKLINRDFLIRNNIFFPVGMKHQEDAVFLYKILTYASTVATINDSTYHYVLPEKGKIYSFKLQDELRGYDEMCSAIDSLINTSGMDTDNARNRLEKRKTNMALHVYNSIQHEPVRKNRIEAYSRVTWDQALSHLDIHPIKKLFLHMRLFKIVDFISKPRLF